MTVERGKPEAAAAIWTPNEAMGRDDAARSARARATIQGAVAGLAGAGLYFGLDHTTMAFVAWSIGGSSMLAGWLSPLGLFAAIERAVGVVGQGVGAAMTWLLLGPVYLLVLTPFGLLARRGARDTLKRSLDANEASYWKKRDPEDQGPSLERPY